MLKFRYLSLSVLTVGMTVPVSWGAYMTSFEAPMFKVGESPARDGWGNVSSGVGVTNTKASDGTQSIKIPSKTANTGIQLVFDGSGATATPADHTFTFDFLPDTATTAGQPFAWFYLYPDDGKLQVKLYNAPDGGHPYMQFSSLGPNYNQTEIVNVLDDTWTHGQWNTMQAKIDVSQHTMNFSINGNDVASVPLSTEAKTFHLFWPLTANYGGDLYIDNVRLTPEPASFALVGLGGAMMLMRRRKKS